MNSDVVVFQEVFHTEALQELCIKSGIYEKSHILTPHTGEDKPRVAIVSKFPITDFCSHIDIPEDCSTEEHRRFRRPPLQATIDLGEGRSIRLFAVHLKSNRPEFLEGDVQEDLLSQAKGTARSLRMRSTEALGIRKLILENSCMPTLIVGDLNDSAASITTEILLGPKPPYRSNQKIREHYWRNRFHSASNELIRRSMQDVTFTYIHDSRHQNIDHVLYSNHLSHRNPNGAGKLVYLQFFNDHVIDRSFGWIPTPEEASDHGQIVAYFQIFTKKLAH